MAETPLYLQDQTQEEILQRMLNNAPTDLDKSEGSYVWDSNAPASIELALAVYWIQTMLKYGFVTTAASEDPGAVTEWVDLRAEETGLTRRPAQQAKGTVTITGAPNTTYPTKGRQVASPADPDIETEAIIFTMDTDAKTDANGTATVGITAVEGGKQGNVPPGAISLLVDTTGLSGITGVTNDEATTGGLDIEDDQSFLARILAKRRTPSSGGNRADYENWALEVPGVGGVWVVPVENGPNNVGVYIINSDKEPADQVLIDAVQDYIVGPRRLMEYPQTYWEFYQNASIDSTTGLNGSVKIAGYGGTGRDLEGYINQGGLWMFFVTMKSDDNTTPDHPIEIGIYNQSTGFWAKTSRTGEEEAVSYLNLSQTTPEFTRTQPIYFWWNGRDRLEWQITTNTEATNNIWIEEAFLISTFSSDEGDGKSPIGAVVTTRSAIPVTIDISVNVTLINGFTIDDVTPTITAAVRDYIRSVALQKDNDIRYSRIASTIGAVDGVDDYSDLLVNGGTGNVIVDENQVAVLGTVTLT